MEEGGRGHVRALGPVVQNIQYSGAKWRNEEVFACGREGSWGECGRRNGWTNATGAGDGISPAE